MSLFSSSMDNTARRQREFLCFGLIGAHERAAAGITQHHDLLDALLAQPLHAHTDVDQRVIEEELIPQRRGNGYSSRESRSRERPMYGAM